MTESRQEDQTATGGDGVGTVHSRFVKYSLLSRSFLTFHSSFFYPYPPSAFHQVLALAISLILLVTLYYFVFAASTLFLQFIMSNFSAETNRILRSCSRQAALGQSLKTQVIVTQKDRFSNEQQIFCDAKRNIIRAAVPTELVYLGIPPAWGAWIADSLTEDSETTGCGGGARIQFNSVWKTLRITIMPTEIHDCCQGWVNKETVKWFVTGAISQQEIDSLCSRVGTTVRDFLGAYEESRKEPDFMIRPGDQRHPSTVVEVGWSDSYPHLERDMRLWIDGTRTVNVVLIIKWSMSSSKVRGSVEAWLRGANGAPTKRQSSVIFPVRQNQPDITITRQELLGSELPPNTNTDGILTLTLASLQDKARKALARMGLQPALE